MASDERTRRFMRNYLKRFSKVVNSNTANQLNMTSNQDEEAAEEATAHPPRPPRDFVFSKLSYGSFAPAPKRPPEETQPDTETSTETVVPTVNPAPGDEGPPNKKQKPNTDTTTTNPAPPVAPPSPEEEPIAQPPNPDKEPVEQQPPPIKPAVQPNPPPNPPQTKTQLIRIIDQQGDLLKPPPKSVLIHACNCLGAWGGGIAAVFKTNYPRAFNIYNAHCKNFKSAPETLVGTALLIPPVGKKSERDRQHYIGCLFTSRAHGNKVDKPNQILAATVPAMGDLLRQIAAEGDKVGEIRMCQINAGLFNVPWAQSKAALQGMTVRDWNADGRLEGLGEFPVDVIANYLGGGG